jgi:diaminohydroxyphosphoribosylaminopyrimidine deaminase/5-amino-6-(5-phosphoribosylamino)uracil reductase
VHWKLAATLDGRVAAPDGSSRWITSAASRREVHALRAAADAVVVGVGTVLRDDPALTARADDGTPLEQQPLRVVVDSAGRTPPGAAVLTAPGEAWVATASEVGADPDRRVDLPCLLAALGRRGVVSVLLEGGPVLAGAFLAAGLVDRVTAYLAPALLGAGRAAVERTGVASIADVLRLEADGTHLVGGDLVVTGRPRSPGTDRPQSPRH